MLVGTCNWADHTDFYPAGVKPNERLAYYARYFPIVEVDSTYYRLMPARNFQLWAERTPPDFVFDVKAYRTLTLHGPTYEPGQRHDVADLLPPEEDFLAFRRSVEPLKTAGKLRALQFQFPPWFTFRESNLEYLGTCREYFPDDLVAVEFRHRSWVEPMHLERTMQVLRDLRVVYTCVDQPQVGSGSLPPIVEGTNPALGIVRFHGRNAKTWYLRGAASSAERFNYRYRPDELAEWLPRIERLAQETAEVHVLMNNNARNYAVVNAADMMRLLGQAPLPSLEE
ncbi:MAG: DUF72 domain-containing protein [Chloroflexi bacterium]|nr:DUF72 domain-containing protein [Chloroflexota bacterium]